ncbi:MAG TPA: alpha-L-fucosidase [Terracidiphilus sp.]|nr:alpha-L-fucosidase [Terracidiphilus sp.]
MKPRNISRRSLILGAAQLTAAAALPHRFAAQAQSPSQQPDTGSGRATWMQKPRYAWGVMTHYLADWQSRVNKLEISVSQWNKMIDGFDVEGMAKRLEQVGAGHYQLSIGQNSGYYLSPNAVYDKIVGITPSKCSQRDLVADFAQVLRARDIKLMVYLPSGAPAQDKQACAALEWLNGPYPNKNFQHKWEQIIAEWSHRWRKNVVAWWFDGCYFPNSMYRSPEPPNFASFAAAARAGNPDSAIAFNPGVIYRLISISPDEDYIAGEIDHPEQASVHRGHDGLMDGAQTHMLSFLGTQWGGGTPRFTTDQVIEYTKKIRDYGGSVTWDVPVQLDGTITDAFLEQLTALGKAFPRTTA